MVVHVREVIDELVRVVEPLPAVPTCTDLLAVDVERDKTIGEEIVVL